VTPVTLRGTVFVVAEARTVVLLAGCWQPHGGAGSGLPGVTDM
jgi:hypothetical protein